MNRRPSIPPASQPGLLLAAGCVLVSGACALVYQTAWLREFRLFFGSSTSATAVVVMVFMGGLGLGSAYFGRRMGNHTAPFGLYAKLELGISLSAACSPLLLMFARWLYLACGGTFNLGTSLGTLLRVVLAGLILLPPTFLLGGTLPALAQAFARDPDRRSVALLYGLNTLGAVLGTLLATFLLFEWLGNRLTLWAASALNLAVALTALNLASRPSQTKSSHDSRTRVRNPVLSGAAATAGFCFFLLELVWYRMLGPILGGSTYTFGIILAIALLGVGLGSLVYALCPGPGIPTLVRLAGVTAVQALCVAAPLAWGDGIALLAVSLQQMEPFTLLAKSVHWMLLTGIVVFPTALVAGYQFPLLIALANRGCPGAEAGSIYAWNTLGAILGSVAGGFGLLPFLTAPGAWRLAALLLTATALILATLGWQGRKQWGPQLLPWGTAIGAWLLLTTPGPSALWRHTPIGAGRVNLTRWSPNDARALLHTRNRGLFWEAEGVESSIGLYKSEGLALMVNGKSDGNSRGDAPTQVLLGVLGAFLHPNPQHALVIGLGTGSSAGWLGQIESIQRVDVVELEPAVIQAARFCGPVNAQALENPKVRIHLGDAREAVLTFTERYDLIASEPSNPYRAGVSSLFTVEFYRAAARRLRPGGLFVQWVQAYEIDGRSIATIYATLGSVFPYLETWQSQPGDLLLVAGNEPFVHPVPQLRNRVEQTPFREAFGHVWRCEDLEGVFANYLANSRLARAYSQLELPINTDDRNVLEFSFAACVGIDNAFQIESLSSAAESTRATAPMTRDGSLEYATVVDRRVSLRIMDGASDNITYPDEACARRIAAKLAYAKGDYAAVLREWAGQDRSPGDLNEHWILARSLAELGHSSAPVQIQRYRELRPSEADALLALYLARTGQYPEAAGLLERCFRNWTLDPWPPPKLIEQSLDLALAIGKEAPRLARSLCNALQAPFAVFVSDTQRLACRQGLFEVIDPQASELETREFIESFEPYVPWTREFLDWRAQNYERTGHPSAGAAQRDLARFFRAEPRPLPPLPPAPEVHSRGAAR